MCDPVTLAAASLAVGTASAAASYVGQSQAADAQDKMNKEAAANAVTAANQNYQYTQQRMAQETAAASTEKLNSNLASAEARATAATSAGESGVQGYSINQLIGSYYSKQGRYTDALDTNYQMSRQGLTDSMDQTSNRTKSAINSLPNPQRPSFLDAAIRVAGSGLNAATDYYKMTGPSNG
jgi:hypothetical protein